MTADLPQVRWAAEEWLLGFARALRAAGLPVTADRERTFLLAVTEVGLAERRQVYWTGRATLTSSPADVERYDQVFTSWFNAEQLWTLALPTVGEDNHHRTPSHAPTPPAIEEDGDGLAEPRPAGPVRHGLPGRHERPVRVAFAQRAGHVGEPRAHGEHLDRAPRSGRLHEGVGQPQQAVGVGAHRARDVDEQDDPARARAPGAVMDAPRLAHAAQLLAERGGAVDGSG